MADDVNRVELTGIVDRWRFDETRRGLPCGSLWLHVMRDGRQPTVGVEAKVNVYGPLARQALSRLDGCAATARARVSGELMQRARHKGPNLTEVRALELTIEVSDEDEQ